MSPLNALQSKKQMSDAQFSEWLGVPRATLRNWKCDPEDKNYRPMPLYMQRYLGMLELLEITVPGFADSYMESLSIDEETNQ